MDTASLLTCLLRRLAGGFKEAQGPEVQTLEHTKGEDLEDDLQISRSLVCCLMITKSYYIL